MIVFFNCLGLAIIAGIIWWFWLSQSKAAIVTTDEVKIVVADGVYTPAQLEIAFGQPIKLAFMRLDQSACAEIVVFEELNIQQTLPFNQLVILDLGVVQPGNYHFHCQMKMYAGTLRVVEPTK